MGKFKEGIQDKPEPRKRVLCCKVCGDLNAYRCGPDNNIYYLCDKHREELKARLGFKNKNDPQIEFNKTLYKVDVYVEGYQAKHPGATKREACMAYAKEKGLALPASLADYEEAQAERQAIQNEPDMLQDMADGKI